MEWLLIGAAILIYAKHKQNASPKANPPVDLAGPQPPVRVVTPPVERGMVEAQPFYPRVPPVAAAQRMPTPVTSGNVPVNAMPPLSRVLPGGGVDIGPMPINPGLPPVHITLS